jgi:DNA-binding transcriptional ArsR family regulator
MERFSIQRRNRMRSHYTITSNVILFGYPKLSDAAKITYQVIDSFDWPDDSGTSKGFAYPSLRLLSRIRGVDRRSIRRHLAELEAAGLIMRREQVGQPNLLIIEDPSSTETENYLRNFDRGGEDKNVLPPSDKNVRPLKKEKNEEDKLVNEEQALEEQEAAKPVRLSAEARAKRDWLANEMLAVLKDEHSLGFYRRIAVTVPEHRIFEGLSLVKQLSREDQIQKTKGAAFTAIVRGPG